MLINLSESFSDRKKDISAAVGRPFALSKREELGQTSLLNLPVSAASIDIYNLLILNEGPSFCNLELRPEGLIISFKVVRDTYALVIPFYKLKVYKGSAMEYSFYKDKYFIRVKVSEPQQHAYIKKLRNFKADQAPPRIEDEP